VLLLKSSGADVVLVAATPKFAAQAIPQDRRNRMEAAFTIHSNVSASISGSGPGTCRNATIRSA